MANSSEIPSFVLGAYGNIGELKYLYFSIMLPWYVSICLANTVVIVVVYVDKGLHEPMYILLCNLCVNEIGGSTSLYPLLLSQVLSETHEVSFPWCFLQMCCIYTSASVEFCSLAAMAYDRYMSICYPLHYHAAMSTGKVFMIILLVWLYSFLSFMLTYSFLIGLKFCGNVIDKVFCDSQLIIKLACSASALSYLSDVCFVVLSVWIPFTLILASYLKILAVCLNTSKENKQKAVSTCVPQIVSVSNLFVGCVFHFIDSRIEATQVPDKVRVILSVYLLVCQPMITPFMYGFKLPKIKQSFRRFVFHEK
ncbi:olfactory receptor 11A1-like [Salarias fasciatus]|nr:olfactory receptor 11A1-like [Salarias fasciatus]